MSVLVSGHRFPTRQGEGEKLSRFAVEPIRPEEEFAQSGAFPFYTPRTNLISSCGESKKDLEVRVGLKPARTSRDRHRCGFRLQKQKARSGKNALRSEGRASIFYAGSVNGLNPMNARNFLRLTISFLACLLLTAGSARTLAAETVRLVVDYGDGTAKVFKALSWTKGMTVEDLLKQAEKVSHGIMVVPSGSGATYFVKKIDDLENEGAGANKKNWQYWLNTDYANVGAGTQKLQPDDVVTWRFDIYRGAK